jgi:acyl-CoA thioesterase I
MVLWAYGANAGLRNGTIALIFSVAVPGGAALAEPVTVVALGDSLTAGYGLTPEEGLVPQLEGWLRASGQDVIVQNAGVSGDTTAGGVSRLDWALGPDADALIVTLGGNDMMRGLPPGRGWPEPDGHSGPGAGARLAGPAGRDAGAHELWPGLQGRV